ncbi:MAG: hypothetical protein K1X82_06090 [Bacteroidia bacterium]|nr:hypothetical protein [Bacteroidia bacterium]
MILFLGIAFVVHIYVPMAQPSNESNLSHIIHLLSYGSCGLAFISNYSIKKWMYGIGAIYPFIYHLNCAIHQWQDFGKFSPVCWLVVVMMPAGLVVLLKLEQK